MVRVPRGEVLVQFCPLQGGLLSEGLWAATSLSLHQQSVPGVPGPLVGLSEGLGTLSGPMF